MPQIPLDFLVTPASELPAFGLEVETPQLLQALKRIAQQKKGEWIHLKYAPGMLAISAGETALEIRAAGAWPEVIAVARSWVQAVLRFSLPTQVTALRMENGKLFVQDLGVSCIVGADAEAMRERRHVSAAAAALNRYGVTPEEIEDLVRDGNPDIARLWGPNDDRIVGDVATAWQCLASYGVETSAIRRLLVRKSRDLWKDRPA